MRPNLLSGIVNISLGCLQRKLIIFYFTMLLLWTQDLFCSLASDKSLIVMKRNFDHAVIIMYQDAWSKGPVYFNSVSHLPGVLCSSQVIILHRCEQVKVTHKPLFLHSIRITLGICILTEVDKHVWGTCCLQHPPPHSSMVSMHGRTQGQKK